jgi:alkanesulfonate monooxygenase SsuD/methylene tetrahydromethanopterin reductase-like flavin-dependent oxidoreductase (luciferase family)
MVDYGYLLSTRGSVLSSDDDQTLAAKTQADVIGLAQRAEASGFRSVWVGDSVLAKPRHEPLSTLAAVGTATESVQLGTAVYLPPLRDPVHVAHLSATVDQLSGGRLALGIGVGSGSDVEAEYANLDLDFGTRGRRMDELLDVVTELWSGESVDYDGDHVTLDDASIGFGPVRDPPIYVPTAAFDPTEGYPTPIRRRLAEYGGGWLPIGLSPEDYATAREGVESILEDADRDPDSVDKALYLDVVVDEDERRALDTAKDFYARYYPARPERPDDYMRKTGAFGPAADVAERLEEFKAAGVEHFAVRFTAPDQRRQLSRFADLADL